MILPDILVPIEWNTKHAILYEFSDDDVSWTEIKNLWKLYKIQFPFCFTPPQTKLDLFFYYACRDQGLPASIGSVYNPALINVFFEEAKNDCLIITQDIFPHFLNKKIFSQILDQINLLVCIGEPQTSDVNIFPKLYKSCSLEILPHPIENIQL